MPRLAWKTSKIGDATITHWARHKAEDVLGIIGSTPLAIVGKTPPVERHRFGPHEIAVRSFCRPEIQLPLARFSLLRKMAEMKCAVIEMPVAFIEMRDQRFVITLWKKGTRNVFFDLEEEYVSRDTAINICLRAMRVLARVHAAGFCHGHLTYNILYNLQGDVTLIDFTQLRQYPPYLEISLGQEVRPAAIVSTILTLAGQNRLLPRRGLKERIQEEGKHLEEEYKRWLDFYLPRYRQAPEQVRNMAANE